MQHLNKQKVIIEKNMIVDTNEFYKVHLIKMVQMNKRMFRNLNYSYQNTNDLF